MPPKSTLKRERKKTDRKRKASQIAETSGSRKKAKREDNHDGWKWWEEEERDDRIKWMTLKHNGPVFPPPYKRVPAHVKFYYKGKERKLSKNAEEVAGFYGRVLDQECATKDLFNRNFFSDWREVMTRKEKKDILDFKKCDFRCFNAYYKQMALEKKRMTKKEKLKIKKENEDLTQKYGFCVIDGHTQKIGNFKIEPPGIFRGRGEHPKMGKLKKRVEPEDILINIGRKVKVPEPPSGHNWKGVQHDNTVSWLACWNDHILGSKKYILLNPSSKVRGVKEWQKYETARKLKEHIVQIRNEYTKDLKSKDMLERERAVALYFIDKLALRAGNEKGEDSTDTVGCCSLRVKNIKLYREKDGQDYAVNFDFLGKDSVRYVNSVSVKRQVFENLQRFIRNKQPEDKLFDLLTTSSLNKYLNGLMEGLTAKVFRTYNASRTLQEQLDFLTTEEMSIHEKVLAYNRANRAVAILCNHQRSLPKNFSTSMGNLKTKIDGKNRQMEKIKKDTKSEKNNDKKLTKLGEQVKRLQIQVTDKEENKTIAMGTSKLNYLDPRITVAWCRKWDVPIEKVYSKAQRERFCWAIDMVGPDYKF